MTESQLQFFSRAEIDQFRRDGFVMVRGLFDPAAMGQITAWTDEVEAYPDAPGKYMKYFEESQLQASGPAQPNLRLLNRLENFAPYHGPFGDLTRSPAVLARVGELFGEAAVLFKDKINFKLPGGGGFEPHQDAQAGWDDYAKLFITVLVSVDPASQENGCLEVAAGHHNRGLIGQLWRPLQGIELKGMDFKPYPTEPGDAIFFDSFAPHQSKPNLSASRRRVLYLTYNRLSEGDHRAQYYADKRKSYPPDCEREPGKVYAYKV
jgi:hypothetical protein